MKFLSQAFDHRRLLRCPTFLALSLALLSFSFINQVTAWCECGYSTIIDGERHVFRDLIESDFADSTYDIGDNTDWQRQAFNLTKDRARGDYGEMFTIDNTNIAYRTDRPYDAGLNLTVSSASAMVDGMVPVAEIDSHRADLYYGTFRASLKLSGIPGTCAAFFWYWNDTQEIDMEFLTKDFNPSNNSYPINLVLQSREAAAANYDASKTDNFVKSYLPFNPTTDFHEYRIDYLPDKVFFYADGAQLAQMNTSAVPTEAGRLILQHWSNGNPLWSGGPPEEDAALQVQYVKAYFNSSDITRPFDRLEGEVCVIPEITPDNHSAADYFFSDHANMTNNQTVWGKSAGSALGEPWSLIGVVVLLTSGWLVGMW